MKPFLTITYFLLAGSTLSAQSHKTKIRQSAEIMMNASDNDVPTAVGYMLPAYVKTHGGKDSLIKTIEADNRKNKLQNMSMIAFIGEPGNEVKYGSIIYSVVPDSLVIRMFSAGFYMKSALVGVSYDEGENWAFATTADLKWLLSVLPDVAKLKIPETTQLMHIGDEQTPGPLNSSAGTRYYLGRRAIALVVVTHSKEYLADTGSIKAVKEKWIKSTVLGAFAPNPADTVKYGTNAVNGVNRYIIDDEKYPDAYLKFIGLMKYVGPAEEKTDEN